MKRQLVKLVFATFVFIMFSMTVFAEDTGKSAPNGYADMFFANGTPIVIQADPPVGDNVVELKADALPPEFSSETFPFNVTGTDAYLCWDKEGATYYLGCSKNVTVFGYGQNNMPPYTDTSVTMTGGSINVLFGGGRGGGTVENTVLALSGGYINFVYGGGENADVSGGTHITLNGSVVNIVYGACYSGVATNVNIEISGGTINNVYAGGPPNGSNSNDVGNTIVKISDAAVIKNSVFGAGRGDLSGITSIGSTEIIMTGGSVGESVFGGGDGGSVIGEKGTTVNISGGTIGQSVFGGSQNGVVSATNVMVTNASVGEGIYGGGLMFGDSEQVSVLGNTNVTIGTLEKSVSHVWGGSAGGCVNGDTFVSIEKTAVVDEVFGAGASAPNNVPSAVNGNTNIKVLDQAQIDNVYGASGLVSGSTNITVSGQSVKCRSIFGGARTGTVLGNSNIVVLSGNVGHISGDGESTTKTVLGKRIGFCAQPLESLNTSLFTDLYARSSQGYDYAKGMPSIPTGYTLAIEAGKSLIIEKEAVLYITEKLTNYGTIFNYGNITGSGAFVNETTGIVHNLGSINMQGSFHNLGKTVNSTQDSQTGAVTGAVTGQAPLTRSLKTENEKTPEWAQSGDLIITVVADFDTDWGGGESGVFIDDMLIPPTEYAAESGSVKITLRQSYLKGLNEGNHALRIALNDGSYVETTLAVTAKMPPSPSSNVDTVVSQTPTVEINASVDSFWSDVHNLIHSTKNAALSINAGIRTNMPGAIINDCIAKKFSLTIYRDSGKTIVLDPAYLQWSNADLIDLDKLSNTQTAGITLSNIKKNPKTGVDVDGSAPQYTTTKTAETNVLQVTEITAEKETVSIAARVGAVLFALMVSALVGTAAVYLLKRYTKKELD